MQGASARGPQRDGRSRPLSRTRSGIPMRSPMRYFVDVYGRRIRDAVNRIVARYSAIEDVDVFDPSMFAWTQILRANWSIIRDEALAILALRDDIPPLSDISPDHQRLDQRRSWRTFFLWGYGYRIDRNCEFAPATAALVERVPGLISAMFSLHEPGTHLPRHHGVTKGMITCHLGLKIPADTDNCVIVVNDRQYHWAAGEFFVFDDTCYHEVWNHTAEDRVILLLHIKRPLRAPGSWLQAIFFGMIRHSPFIQDARRNMATWTERFARNADGRVCSAHEAASPARRQI